MSFTRADATRHSARNPSSSDARDSHAELVAQAIRAFQAGTDREASFRFLFRSYHRSLQRFFAGKGLPADVCQDLTQETFFGVYRGLEAYEDRMRFEAWLFRLATNTYRKRLRDAGAAKRSGHEMQIDGATEEEIGLWEPPGQLQAVLHEERRQTLRRVIRELPEQMRKCLTLRLYHELSYREIAVVMKLKIDTVKAHLFQARRRLREKLEGYDVGELNL